MVNLLVRLGNPRPSLIVDATGIVDQASAASAGRIPWEDIAGFEISSVHGQKFLAVHVKDPAELYDRTPWFKRRLMKLNASVGGAPVNLP